MKSIEVRKLNWVFRRRLTIKMLKICVLEGRVRQIETQLPIVNRMPILERVISVEQASRALSRRVVLLD